MTARPWPNRYTRAHLAGLKGFVVRPRMEPIVQKDLGLFDNPTVVNNGGWRDPFYDEEGNEIREDGVNLGTEDSAGAAPVESSADHTVRGASIKRRRASTQGLIRKGLIDWRSSDGKVVLTWDAGSHRYFAGGVSEALFMRGKVIGSLPDQENGRGRFISGACVYTDTDTATRWIVVVAWEGQLLTERADNDYVEEVWMRRYSTQNVFEATTEEEINQKIAEATEPGLTDEEREQRRQALKEEARKWINVADIDADPLLPIPPSGDPKVAPRSSDLAPWLFNASGTECQTIRMVTANPGGNSDIEDFEPQSRHRLKIQLAYSVSSEEVLGDTIHIPSASIASALGFDVLTGTLNTSSVGNLSSNHYDQHSEQHLLFEHTVAVDYSGDQEIFLVDSVQRDSVYDEVADWTDPPDDATTWSEDTVVTIDRTIEFAGNLLTSHSETRDLLEGSKESEPPFMYSLGINCTAEEGSVSVPADAIHTDTDDITAITFRWIDLRNGILHYAQHDSTRNWDTSAGGTATKGMDERSLVDGLDALLDSVSDDTTLDPIECDTDNTYDHGTDHDTSDSEDVTFLMNYPTVPSPRAYSRPLSERLVGWDKDHEGNVLGSALLGIDFRPFGAAANDNPYGHETVYNRYDGAEQSIQALFEIQAVEPEDVFVCYPVKFIGA